MGRSGTQMQNGLFTLSNWQMSFSSEHDSLHKAWRAIHFLKNVAIVWGPRVVFSWLYTSERYYLRVEPQNNEGTMILINEGKNKLVLTISSRASVSFRRGGSNCSLSTTKHYIFKFNTDNIIPVPFQCLLQWNTCCNRPKYYVHNT